MSEDGQPPVRRGLRRRVAANPATEIAWRIAVGVVGGTITFLGVVFLITPGPGWLVIFVGLGILASEFAWAERALMKAKLAGIAAKNRAMAPARRRWVYAGVFAIVSLLGAGLWLWLR